MDTQPLRAGGELTEIIDRYQTTVFGLALAKTGSRADADDVFQEVFLAYYQSGKTFRDEEHRKAWLLRTTLNLCRRVTQSSWRKKTVPLSQREDTPVRFQAGGKPGMAGPLRAGGDLSSPPVSVLFPGAVHPGDRQGPVYPAGRGAHASDPGTGAAAPGSERRLFP